MIRVTNRRMDGTSSTDPITSDITKGPYPRGKDLRLTRVNSDGSETPITNASSIQINCDGRTSAVTATINYCDADVLGAARKCTSSTTPVDMCIEVLEDNDELKIALLEARYWRQKFLDLEAMTS